MLKTGKQIKRNVVSLITKNENGISAIKLLAGLVAILSISQSFPIISLGADLEIRQGTYLYQLPFAQVVSAETFVISTASKKNSVKMVISQKSTQPTPTPGALFSNPISVHFKIDSAEIAPEEQTQLFSQLQEFEVPQNAPLAVTGFTCTMGPAEFNAWLSEERAKAVAGLLEKEGYTVAKIEGKGAKDLVSKHYAPLNRRVEVTPSETSSARTGQSQFSTKEETP